MATAEYLNVRDAARLLGVHENTIRNWQEKGILRAIRLPGSGYRRFDRAQIERMHNEMVSAIAPDTVLEGDEMKLKGRMAKPGDLL